LSDTGNGINFLGTAASAPSWKNWPVSASNIQPLGLIPIAAREAESALAVPGVYAAGAGVVDYTVQVCTSSETIDTEALRRLRPVTPAPSAQPTATPTVSSAPSGSPSSRRSAPQAAIEIVDIVPTLDLPVDTNVIIPTEDQPETPTKTTKTIKITTMTMI
jgi:hypothetical protein